MRKTGQTLMTVAAAAAITGFALVGLGCESTSNSDSAHPTTQSDHLEGEHGDHPEGDHPEGDHPEGDHPSGDHPDHPE